MPSVCRIAANPRVEVVYSDLGTDSVYAFKPGQYTSYATLTTA